MSGFGAAPTSQSHRLRQLALNKLSQDAVPFNGRALAWSPDAELAVATSDSVYVYVPQFTSAAGSRMPIFSERDGEALCQDLAESQFASGTETRNQFAAGFRRIPVGYPRLDHRLNYHLFSVLTPGEPGSDTGSWQEELPRISAGSGPISGSGSSMNSVVSMAWSPSGVGRNRRPIIGVLTTSGTLVLYGEPLETEQHGGGSKLETHGRSSYDTSRWEILWAVGERLAVPGQKKTGECIVSFAWTEGCDLLVDEGSPKLGEPPRRATQAFLLYQTDKRDVVVLKVSHLRHGDGTNKWHVVEVSRRRVPGPHTVSSRWGTGSSRPQARSDHSFVPPFTPFGLRCSPYMIEQGPAGAGGQCETALTCLVGYLAPHYVGFRRLSAIWRPNAKGVQPEVYFDDYDCAGYCTFLTGNAMLEFEPGLWEVPRGSRSDVKRSVARCVVATPSSVESYDVEFEAVPLAGPAGPRHVVSEHVPGSDSCSADTNTIPENHTNPITGLVVHPPDPRSRGERPLYSIVRQSASSSLGWYATNACKGFEVPKWVDWVEDRIPSRTASQIQDGVRAQYGEIATDNSSNKSRIRVWGLDQAPGGVPGHGTITAVLVSEHSTHGSRDGRERERSHVLFGYQGDFTSTTATTSGERFSFHRPAVSTEAAMWSYMYGSGPSVMSIEEKNGGRLFEEQQGTTASQTCSICEAQIRTRGEVSICDKGHSFDRCTGTGLAIQRPNISQACGVCGRRCLRLDALDDMMRYTHGTNAEDQAHLQAKLLAKVCGFCGGKFYE